MKKYLQIFLLLVAMLLPWATQAQVSCPPGQTSCNVVVMMWDSYGDGWDYGDCYLEFYSGSTLLGSASLLDGSTGSTTVPVCEGDSIRVVWNDPWDGCTDEISFRILSMGGDTLMEVSDASMYNDGQTMTTFEATSSTTTSSREASLTRGRRGR